MLTELDKAKLEFWKDKPDLIQIGEWKVSIHCATCFGELRPDHYGITPPDLAKTSRNSQEISSRCKCPHCGFVKVDKTVIKSRGYPDQDGWNAWLPHIVVRKRFITTRVTGGFFKSREGFWEYEELKKVNVE